MSRMKLPSFSSNDISRREHRKKSKLPPFPCALCTKFFCCNFNLVMKYPKLFLTFIFLINCIFLFGQSSANKEFLDSKGTWSLPISSCIKIINYGSSKRIGHGCDFGPRISFKTNKIQPIIAVYKGIVVSVFNVGDVCAAMTRYGDYFITYSQLGVVYVK